MGEATTVTVRALALDDRADWERLYQGYADFYGVAQDQAMRARVWDWLHDPAHECEGLVAEASAGGAARALVGLTHFRPFARPLSATTGCFLDDLFVLPEARGAGTGAALIEAVRRVAAARGWSVLRWITRADNHRARVLYDRVAVHTAWVTYDIVP